jgi:chromosome segregation ATPase
LHKELEELKSEWNEYKKPINDEIQDQKNNMQEKKMEYQYKAEKIKNIKKEFKDAITELEEKKNLLVFYNV